MQSFWYSTFEGGKKDKNENLGKIDACLLLMLQNCSRQPQGTTFACKSFCTLTSLSFSFILHERSKAPSYVRSSKNVMPVKTPSENDIAYQAWTLHLLSLTPCWQVQGAYYYEPVFAAEETEAKLAEPQGEWSCVQHQGLLRPSFPLPYWYFCLLLRNGVL